MVVAEDFEIKIIYKLLIGDHFGSRDIAPEFGPADRLGQIENPPPKTLPECPIPKLRIFEYLTVISIHPGNSVFYFAGFGVKCRFLVDLSGADVTFFKRILRRLKIEP